MCALPSRCMSWHVTVRTIKHAVHVYGLQLPHQWGVPNPLWRRARTESSWSGASGPSTFHNSNHYWSTTMCSARSPEPMRRLNLHDINSLFGESVSNISLYIWQDKKNWQTEHGIKNHHLDFHICEQVVGVTVVGCSFGKIGSRTQLTKRSWGFKKSAVIQSPLKHEK